MNDKLCVCGHRQEEHLQHTGCWAHVNRNYDVCGCTKFIEQPSTAEVLKAEAADAFTTLLDNVISFMGVDDMERMWVEADENPQFAEMWIERINARLQQLKGAGK